MDSALWPSTLPELFRHAAGRLLTEADDTAEGPIVERLRSGLGLDQVLTLGAPEVILAREAARSDERDFDRLALTVTTTVGRQLLHQYPSSSLLWDAVRDELHDVFGAFGFTRSAAGVWTREAIGHRTIVIELKETGTAHPDDRRFTLCWGVVLPTVPFCRHGGPHRTKCCAISGGMGSVRVPHGEHTFILTVGVVLEALGDAPLRMIGREGFRARLHRLATFCERVVERERLVELVSGQPWRSGIGIAERLRNADPDELRQLLP